MDLVPHYASGRRGVVDLGSNSVRLVVFEGTSRNPMPIFNEKAVLRLGRGLQSTGRLNQDGVEAALKVMRRYYLIAKAMGASPVEVLATAAVRDAANDPQFVDLLRERLPDELATLFRDLGLTVLYVTHDHDEALRVADRVVLLRGGGIEADGTPEALWSAPPTRATADFLGFRTIADGELRDGTLETPWGSLPAPAGAPAEGLVGLVLRPDALRLDPTGPIGGTVTARRFRGDHVLLVVTPDGMPPLEVEARGGGLPATGERVRVTIDPAGIVLLQDRTAGARYPSGS